jgi:hypothetical protein
VNQERFDGFMAAYGAALRAKIARLVAAGDRAVPVATRVPQMIATARQAIYKADYSAPGRVDAEALSAAMAQLCIKPKGIEPTTKALDRYLERMS